MANSLDHYQPKLELLKELGLQRDMLETHERNNASRNTNAQTYKTLGLIKLSFGTKSK